MAYVETEGYLSRLGGSIKGVLVGIIFFVVSFPLLWWNEGRAVKTARSLEEGATSVVSVTKLDPANEGKLIHFSGDAHSDETLTDAEFGVSAAGLRLRRKVEMYQWEERSESRQNTGGSKTTTYTYDKKWSPLVISSHEFKEAGHDNPPQMKVPDNDLAATHAKLGDFALSSDVIHQLDRWEPVAAELAKVPRGEGEQVKQSGASLFVGGNPGNPEVGDARVSFDKVGSPVTMSIVAQQAGGGFAAFPTKAGRKLLLTAMDTRDAATMFKQAEEANAHLTWILRGVAWLLMTLGVFLVLRPITMVANFIPFAGSLLSTGAFLLAAVGATGLSLVTVAVAWIAYRPVLGIALLVGAAVMIFGAMAMMRGARARKQVAA
jgi:hypothetical protein